MFSGETGCLPNCKKKGEKPVALETEVFIAKAANGNFSTQSSPTEFTNNATLILLCDATFP